MDDIAATDQADFTQLTVDIVSAYVSKNSVRAADLPGLIAQVHTAFVGLSKPAAAPEEAVEKASPAQIRKSITPDALISFLDGKPYKTLKRHLSTHGLDFETYRARYGLPSDYPTVSATYSSARSALAKELGLGQQRRKAVHMTAEPVEMVAEPLAKASRRGGRKKVVEAAAGE